MGSVQERGKGKEEVHETDYLPPGIRAAAYSKVRIVWAPGGLLKSKSGSCHMLMICRRLAVNIAFVVKSTCQKPRIQPMPRQRPNSL